jgi:superfamily II DNA or RNA helicase/very-short-patch-repair endonuclease
MISKSSQSEEKINLFRSYFKGRGDVYARRFESRKSGKSGYSPACANEWIRGVCDKRKVRCADCPNRRFIPVSDDIVRQHLVGSDAAGHDFVMGFYPMLSDECCFFVAVDFDKEQWRKDVIAVADTCRRMEVASIIEISRSGNGAHLWIFFEEAVAAVAARKLAAHLLTETMERRPDIGMESYDRLFPNQDTMPKGGFGNLIALPLQGRARKVGGSVFVDEKLLAYEDQWQALSQVKKISSAELNGIVDAAERRGRIIGVQLAVADEDGNAPWKSAPSRLRREPKVKGRLPKKIEIVLANEVYLPKEPLSACLQNRLIRLAAFQNPEFYKAQAMRLSTFDKSRVISCAENHLQYIGLPRGCLDDVLELMQRLGIETELRDERYCGVPLEVGFCGKLRSDQKSAADSLLAHDSGVLAAATAFGKTVVAAWIIAQRSVNTLIVVHRRQLQEQWVERLSEFLGVAVKDIGRIGGGRKKRTGVLDVALIQSLVRKGVVNDCVGEYGQIIVDECHHLPASSFEQVARRAKAKYVLGLSATVIRKDGWHPIITMQCGAVRHRVSAVQQTDQQAFVHNVLVRSTSFRFMDTDTVDISLTFNDIYKALIFDENRNQLICDDILKVLREGRSPVVLTERTDHLKVLHNMLAPHVQNLIVLQGGMGRKLLRETLCGLGSVSDNEERLILATGRYIGEGFDDARLDTLFLTMPISWRGTVAQYAGRLHRRHDRKREVRIYDYADLNVSMLARMFDRRCKGYKAIGYTILLPASAVPGWPEDVPLPVEPEWKRNYAASVQRLIKDGVDTHLGNLFVYAARKYDSNAQGVARARSATEAFLYRRLETISQTSGRFSLNIKLPIPFAGQGKMEIDLLCEDCRLAVELDGPHHFADADAYRLDRRKDMLLQENGYFVLRFLAEDVGKHLDDVLDAIIRVLVHQSHNKL